MLRWSRNSCFLDSLLLVLLREAPSRYVQQHLLDPPASELAAALRRVRRHLAAGRGTITSDAVRALLPAAGGYDSFDDGQPHDSSEVLRQLLQHFGCPDTLETVSLRSVRDPGTGCWHQRTVPTVQAEAPLWIVAADQLPQTTEVTDLNLVLRDEQKLDTPVLLSATDRREMMEACLPEQRPPRFDRYREFRTLRSIRALGGDHLFVDLRRTRLHPTTMQEVRTITPVRPPATLELAGGQVLELDGVVLHCAMHYLAVVRCRRDGMWDLLDDQHPEQCRRLTLQQLQSDKALLCHMVLLSYCAGCYPVQPPAK